MSLLRPSCPKPILLHHCCCRLADSIAVADNTVNPSLLCHHVVTAVDAVLPQPLTQIHNCTSAIAITSVLLLPRYHPDIAANPSLLQRSCYCFDVAAASLPPLPPGPIKQIMTVTVSALSLLPFLLLTISPSQVRSATVLSQPLLPSCRTHCHKYRFASLQ